jgi:serine/threonine protein kinase
MASKVLKEKNIIHRDVKPANIKTSLAVFARQLRV